ncbi:MAG: hypothetical protein R3F45_02460 [Gammaproteobacteria bacterium]
MLQRSEAPYRVAEDWQTRQRPGTPLRQLDHGAGGRRTTPRVPSRAAV